MGAELERAQPWPARIEARSAALLRKEIGRAMAAGELAACGPVRRVEGGYAVEVYRLKDRAVAPAWRRPVLIATGVALVLAGAGAAGWYLVSATVAAAGAVSLPLVIGGLAVLLVGRLALRGSSGHGCETTVTVSHRCR